MAFKIHGVSMSTCTRRVALIAKERNLQYEVVPINFNAAEHKQPPHLQHQPFGQIPYMTQDDGFELFESRAIGRYLATIGSGPELIPTEPKARAKFEQAASIEYSNFDPIASVLAKEKAFKKLLGGEPDEKLVEELVGKLEGKLDGYETILGKQKYLAGDNLTVADLFHLPYGSICFDQLGYGNFDKRPNVKRWWNDISSRPSWQAVKNEA
ncbi:glutathione S-transferase [Russula aff. rugulosa BPL654]|nr:glutathione S-transferase [Russula aff. rugulosa BPL654]